MKPLDSVSVKTDHESQTISDSHLLTSVDRQLGRRVPYGANRMDHWQRKWGSDSGIIQSRHSRRILPITRSQMARAGRQRGAEKGGKRLHTIDHIISIDN